MAIRLLFANSNANTNRVREYETSYRLEISNAFFVSLKLLFLELYSTKKGDEKVEGKK